MEHIFIDASVFVAENFLEGNRIKELYRLFREGRFKNVMPLITVNEIKNQFRNRVTVAIEEHNLAMNNKKLWVLKNHVRGTEILSKFPKADVLASEFNKNFDKLLKDAKTEIIPYPTLDTKPIFDKYFKGEKPFGKSDKKHEFPDAFAVESLKHWCKTKRKKCIVLTTDSDFKMLKEKHLLIESDYKKYMSQTLSDILVTERKEMVELLFKKNKTKLETDVELWLRDTLDDTSLFMDAVNWMDVHSIEIPLVAITIKKYQITSIEGEVIKAEAVAHAVAEIELETDDEQSGVRDMDDKNFYYRDTAQLNIKEEFEIPLSIVFRIKSKKEYNSDISIEEYNDGKELEISYSPYDY